MLPIYQESVETTTGLDVVIRFGNGTLGVLDIMYDLTRHSSYLTHINVFGTGMDTFVRWLTNGEPVETELARVLPTMQLLDDVAARVPRYAAHEGERVR